MMKIAGLLLLLASQFAFAHGNLAVKDGACTFKASTNYAIHFTAYQPSTHEGEVFCQSAPDLVETTIVLDFMEKELKELPVAFSIGYVNKGEVQPIKGTKLAQYPQGFLTLNFTPEEKGQYRGTFLFIDEQQKQQVREIDFYIGELGPNSREPSSTQEVIKWIVMVLIALSVFYFLYIRTKVKRDQD